MGWLDSITNSVDMNLSKFPEIEEDRGTSWATVPGGPKELDVTLVTEQRQQQTVIFCHSSLNRL